MGVCAHQPTVGRVLPKPIGVRLHEYSRSMRPLSPTQMSALQQIEDHGLIVPSVSLDGPFAMARLDLPAPEYEIVRVTTARRLARDRLIAPKQYAPPPGEVVIEWEITDAGRALLHSLGDGPLRSEAAS